MGEAYHPPSSSTEWRTPKWLFDKLHEEFLFQMDVCASPHNAMCGSYFDKDQDCLVTD